MIIYGTHQNEEFIYEWSVDVFPSVERRYDIVENLRKE